MFFSAITMKQNKVDKNFFIQVFLSFLLPTPTNFGLGWMSTQQPTSGKHFSQDAQEMHFIKTSSKTCLLETSSNAIDNTSFWVLPLFMR